MERNAFVTVDEAVKLLHISRRTLYNYFNEGLLEKTKPVGRVYITQESIQSFMKKKKEKEKKKKK